jgi:hypothetical protein
VKYSCDLARDVDWRTEMDLRSGYRIDLSGDAPLRMAGSPEVTAWSSVTIRFDSSSIRPPGSAQKFDISIELMQPLDADGLCIVQEFRDWGAGRTFSYEEEGGQTDPQRTLTLVDDEGTATALYSWSDAILIGDDVPDTPSHAVSGYALSPGMAEVLFSYPLKNGTMAVYHDPTVGMDPDFIPDQDVVSDFMTNRPLGMALGIVIGLALVLGAVAAVRFRRG